MKKLFILQLLMFVGNIAFTASVIPILKIDNIHPIADCNYAHCVLKIENPSAINQRLAVNFKHDLLKIANSTVPTEITIIGGESQEYTFDVLIENSERHLDSVSIVINLQSIDEPSMIIVKRMLYPVYLNDFDPSKTNELLPCKKNIFTASNEVSLNSDVILQNGMTIIAKPSSKIYLLENFQDKEKLKRISIIGCQEKWDAIVLSKQVSNNMLVNEDIDYQIYPNPTSDFIYIKTSINDNVEANLLSSDGKILGEFSIGFNSPISVKDLPEGLYFIHIKSSSDKIIYKSFIKNN